MTEEGVIEVVLSDVEPDTDDENRVKRGAARRSRSRTRRCNKRSFDVQCAASVADDAIPLGIARVPTRPAKPYNAPKKTVPIPKTTATATITSSVASLNTLPTTAAAIVTPSAAAVASTIVSALSQGPIQPQVGVPQHTCNIAPALFPIRARDIVTTINKEPHRSATQIAGELSSKYHLNPQQHQTVRLMTATAIVAKTDTAHALRKILCSGDSDTLEGLKQAITNLAEHLDRHPETDIGE